MSTMRRKGWIAASTALLILVLSGSLSVSAQSADGELRGQVANWTEGGGPVDEILVTLDTYQGTSYLGSSAASTNANGTFEFTGLETAPEYVYQMSLRYQEADYAFDWFSFEEDATEKTVKLAVYDSTSDSSAVMIDRAHAIMTITSETIEVTEWYLFSNPGDKAYVGTEDTDLEARTTLEFSVPAHAADLQLGGGLADWTVSLTADGFADTSALFPGTKEVLFAYSLDYDSDAFTLPLKFLYPVASFDLMVGGQYADVQCDALAPSTPLGSGSDQYSHFTAQAIERGTTLDIELSGLQSSTPGGLPPAAIAAIALAHVTVLGLIVVRKRRRRAGVAVTSDPDVLAVERQRLVEEMAALDDSYERGDLPEDEYQRLRSEKKGQLVDLIRRSRG